MRSEEKLLIRALRREPTPRPPVWLMRQAGRYLPEYRAVRTEAGGFLEMVHAPELAAEVTLQPIRRFGMDAAILFSDILVPLAPMGIEVGFGPGGPNLPNPVRTAEDVDRLRTFEPAKELPYVGKALELTAKGLPEETALIGFCGAPFTLASYAMEGGTSKAFAHLRRFMYHETPHFERFMDKLADVVAAHLAYQIESGAEAVVLFDTWAASLTLDDYRRFAAPWSKRVLEALSGSVPRIAFAGAADHLLEEVAGLGSEAVAIDYRTDIAGAFERTDGKVALQGNLDPAALLAPPEEVTRRTNEILDAVGGRPGHVLNLGHGVIKHTDPDCVAAFVNAAKERAK